MNYDTPPTSAGRQAADSSPTSITERTLARIDTSLGILSNTMDMAETTFGGVLRNLPPSQDKATGEIKEAQQSLLHGSLIAILDQIDHQQRRLAGLIERSTL